MNNELIQQFAHTWRTFDAIVSDFDTNAWLHTGRGVITPARLSLHLLQSIQYYIEDVTFSAFASGRDFHQNWETMSDEEHPSKDDIRAAIHDLRGLTENWLRNVELQSVNTTFDWAGKTKMGVVIFTLRHFVYHMGELSSLLNESRNGKANDNFKNTVSLVS